jgi:hypothetical protein
VSSQNYIHVHQSEHVVFDDIDALNEQLDEDHYIHELCEVYEGGEDADFVGWLDQDEPGEQVYVARFEDHQFVDYFTTGICVWNCWSNAAAQIIAGHISSGKLVLKYEQEGGFPDEYYVLTPNKVSVVTSTELVF